MIIFINKNYNNNNNNDDKNNCGRYNYENKLISKVTD